MDETTFFHSRVFSVSKEDLFEAFTTPELLQKRRGPKGFTNEFALCEPVTGGKWVYTMIGPNGAKHPNESVFTLISPDKIVIDHLSKPHYVLTITLQEEEQGTRLTREQAFDTPEIYQQIQGFVRPANEENIDRLENLLG